MRRLCTLVLVLAATVAAPRAGEAQIGGFIKRKIAEKAGEKIVEKAGEKAGEKTGDSTGGRAGQRRGSRRMGGAAPAAFDTPFTADTLDALLSGLEAMTASLARADSLGRAQAAVDEQLRASQNAHAAEADAYRARETASSDCQRKYFHNLTEQRGAELQRRANSDPAFAQRMAAKTNTYMVKMAEAQQRGDTAEAERAYSQMLSIVLGSEVDLKKDSVEAVKRCGKIPPRPAFLAQEDKLAARASDLADRKRQAELDAQAVALEKSRMSNQRLALARERLEQWYLSKARNTPGPWSPQEDELLGRQRARIERVMRALGVQA